MVKRGNPNVQNVAIVYFVYLGNNVLGQDRNVIDTLLTKDCLHLLI